MEALKIETTKKYFDNEVYNEPVFQSNNFIAIPSLGSLVKGWLLIVPKKHYLCFGELGSESLYAELEDFINKVRTILNHKYGNTVLFEHGPSKTNLQIGCGVDYAHIHLVPFNEDLILGLNKFYESQYNWTKVQSIRDTEKLYIDKKSYLFFSSQNTESFVASGENFPSQIFRKVIASYLGTPEKYDWKYFSFLENIQDTKRDLITPYNHS